MGKKFVLVTGAAGGLGKAIVSLYLEKEWNVIGLDINSTVNSLSAQNNYFPFNIDIGNKESVEQCFTTIKTITSTIDVLINNAVIQQFFPLSTCDDKKIQELYNINVFGILRITQATIPFLISAKGRVINISSESVKFPSLFQPYQASKIAMEAIHKTLRQELYLLGIKMVLIRPGAINTPILERTKNIPPAQQGEMFEKEFKNFSNQAAKYIGKSSTPEKVAKKIFLISVRKNPKGIYHYKNNYLLTLMSLIPDSWMLRFVKKSVESK